MAIRSKSDRLIEARGKINNYLTHLLAGLSESTIPSLEKENEIHSRMGKPAGKWVKEKWPDEDDD